MFVSGRVPVRKLGFHSQSMGIMGKIMVLVGDYSKGPPNSWKLVASPLLRGSSQDFKWLISMVSKSPK